MAAARSPSESKASDLNRLLGDNRRLKEDRKICCGWKDVEVIKHICNVSAVICGVVDHMQENISARHGSDACANELKLHHLTKLVMG